MHVYSTFPSVYCPCLSLSRALSLCLSTIRVSLYVCLLSLSVCVPFNSLSACLPVYSSCVSACLLSVSVFSPCLPACVFSVSVYLSTFHVCCLPTLRMCLSGLRVCPSTLGLSFSCFLSDCLSVDAPCLPVCLRCLFSLTVSAYLSTLRVSLYFLHLCLSNV